MMSKNVLSVCECFEKDVVRNDHCDGEHLLYRFCAYEDIDEMFADQLSSLEKVELRKRLLSHISSFQVLPLRIVLYGTRITYDWASLSGIVINSMEDYKKRSIR